MCLSACRCPSDRRNVALGIFCLLKNILAEWPGETFVQYTSVYSIHNNVYAVTPKLLCRPPLSLRVYAFILRSTCTSCIVLYTIHNARSRRSCYPHRHSSWSWSLSLSLPVHFIPHSALSVGLNHGPGEIPSMTLCCCFMLFHYPGFDLVALVSCQTSQRWLPLPGGCDVASPDARIVGCGVCEVENRNNRSLHPWKLARDGLDPCGVDWLAWGHLSCGWTSSRPGPASAISVIHRSWWWSSYLTWNWNMNKCIRIHWIRGMDQATCKSRINMIADATQIMGVLGSRCVFIRV